MAVYLAKLFPRVFFIFFCIREFLFLSLSSLLPFQQPPLLDIGIARNLIEATGAQIHVTLPPSICLSASLLVSYWRRLIFLSLSSRFKNYSVPNSFYLSQSQSRNVE